MYDSKSYRLVLTYTWAVFLPFSFHIYFLFFSDIFIFRQRQWWTFFGTSETPPSVMVELLPNDSNIKKYQNWWFVPLPIAYIHVPSSIHIIQPLNYYTSETKKYVCPSLTLLFVVNEKSHSKLVKNSLGGKFRNR